MKHIKDEGKDAKESFLERRRRERAEKAEADSKRLSFFENPALRRVKPKERYFFCSDYFQVDDYYCTILTFVHNDAAADNYGTFWGINRIPVGMPQGVVTVNFEQVSRMGESWIADHQDKAEGVAEVNENEQDRGGTNSSKGRASKASRDFQVIAEELNDGASYLHVNTRLLIKAPSLDVLDQAVQHVSRLYMDKFGTLSAAPYIGDQRLELSTLFSPNLKKRGSGFYFTSTEYAGSYSLVTHGLEDAGGEFVGSMVGDVNNSAVVLDVDDFRHHVVVALEQINTNRKRAHVSDMWGQKETQACLMNGGRVIQLLLGPCDMSQLGPEFKSFTTTIDLNSGDVNMFEMFGDEADELAIFPAQLEKLTLMAEQAYPTTDADRSIIRGSLKDIATTFYVDQRMWHADAGENRDKLRVVGLPHEDVPRLQMFVSYLDYEYKALVAKAQRDEEKLHALSVLSMTFSEMLSANGDIFNSPTSDYIDNVKGGRRVIYDFSSLMRRSTGVAMAQLVNVIDYAVAQLGYHDLVVVHSAENIAPEVRDYVGAQFEKLFHRGGRVVFLYNDTDRMLRDTDFNHFDKADYTIVGNMSENTMKDYQEKLGQSVPPDLINLVTSRTDAVVYIRRGFDNVVFKQDLRLDIDDAVGGVAGTHRRSLRQGIGVSH